MNHLSKAKLWRKYQYSSFHRFLNGRLLYYKCHWLCSCTRNRLSSHSHYFYEYNMSDFKDGWIIYDSSERLADSTLSSVRDLGGLRQDRRSLTLSTNCDASDLNIYAVLLLLRYSLLFVCDQTLGERTFHNTIYSPYKGSSTFLH